MRSTIPKCSQSHATPTPWTWRCSPAISSPLLERYEAALGGEDDSDADLRHGLADAILQGLSADPDLLITRLELLGPATMVEEVFVDAAAEGPRYTAPGERHAALIRSYRDLLHPSCGAAVRRVPRARPRRTGLFATRDLLRLLCRCSVECGARYADGTTVFESLARRPVREPDPSRRESHTCAHLGTAAHIGRRAPALHPFAGVGAAGVRETSSIACGDSAPATPSARTGRLFVRLQSIDSLPGSIPDSAVSAQEHVVTSDIQWALNAGATAFPKSHLLADRREGRYLASVEQDGKWFAVSKVLLTACLAQGRDAVIAGVPDPVAVQLRVTCPEIVKVELRNR